MKAIVVMLTVFVALTTGKIARLHMVNEAIEDQYIVVVKPRYDTAVIKRFILDDVSGIFNGTLIKHTYTKAIKGFSAKLDQNSVEKLRTRKEIKYIIQDGVARTLSVASWGLDRISQRHLPLDGTADFKGNGSGVNVYIIDTGIYPDSLYFNGRAEPAFDVNPKEGAYGIDCNGHGTHCAGTIGGTTYGVAPGVGLYGVRVLNCKGSGPISDVIKGIDFVANSGRHPAVASLSLGGFANKALDNAIKGMIEAGITVVVAAGNSNWRACKFSPARVHEAITVGATDIDDNRADFSDYGKCVDIFAPGVDITSAWIGGPEETRTISGTSMACPHVAGAAAIALASNPGYSPAKIMQAILNNSTEGVISKPGKRSPNLLLYVPSKTEINNNFL